MLRTVSTNKHTENTFIAMIPVCATHCGSDDDYAVVVVLWYGVMMII